MRGTKTCQTQGPTKPTRLFPQGPQGPQLFSPAKHQNPSCFPQGPQQPQPLFRENQQDSPCFLQGRQGPQRFHCASESASLDVQRRPQPRRYVGQKTKSAVTLPPPRSSKRRPRAMQGRQTGGEGPSKKSSAPDLSKRRGIIPRDGGRSRPTTQILTRVPNKVNQIDCRASTR
jgi:hypothetical protein